MSEPDIKEIGRIFAFRVMHKPEMPNGFVDSDTIVENLAAKIAKGLEQVGGEKALGASELAEVIFEELKESPALVARKIPYSKTVYQFDASAYSQKRTAVLMKNRIHADAGQIPEYFESVFEGYQKTQLGERTDPLTESELRDIEWTKVTERLSGTAIKSIKQKIVELATAIQQSDLSDREKGNLLARTRAVDELLTAPDPDWKAIVSLLNNKYLCAFLNTLALLQLIIGVV